jgi:pimeloyl-ACP methyl ester carboxylesterase
MASESTTELPDASVELPAIQRVHELADLGEAHPDWAGIRTEWMDVAGAKVRLLRHDSAADGPLVLLVHGLGGTTTNWLPVMRGLSALGPVVAVDLPGFGETAPPRPTTARPRANARFLATLVRALDAGPVVAVGNSMGGAIVTLLAADHPELVQGLVLLGPALPPRLVGLVPSRFLVNSFGPMLLPVLGPKIIRKRLAAMTFDEQYRSGMRQMVAEPDAIPEHQMAVGVANLARVTQLRWRGPAFLQATAGLVELQVGPARRVMLDSIRRITAPTLYIRGAQDPLVLAATTAMVRRLRPDWTIEEPDAMGHVPMLEAPDWTVRRIIRFVEGADAARQGPQS